MVLFAELGDETQRVSTFFLTLRTELHVWYKLFSIETNSAVIFYQFTLGEQFLGICFIPNLWGLRDFLTK